MNDAEEGALGLPVRCGDEDMACHQDFNWTAAFEATC